MATLLSIAVPGENYADGSQVTRLAGNRELVFPHSLVVNDSGKRVGNEAFFQDIAPKLKEFDTYRHRFINIPCFLIFDQSLIETFSFAGMPPGETEGLEWVARGNSLSELAQRLNMPAAELESTVARFNEQARQGKDEDFGRPAHTLGPMEKPPFYGVELVTTALSSAGIIINTDGQVMHVTGRPIPGLYASGNAAAFLDIGAGYQSGMSLMHGMIFGYLAAQHMAQQA